MLNLEKESPKANSENNSSHTFIPTSNVRNGFRRKKGDSPFTYNLNLKVKKEKKQSNFTNPDPWARIVGSRNTAAIYMNGTATTALFDTGAEIQLVSKQFCEDNEWEIQPIEKLTECSTVNGEIFGYEGFVEVNVQIPGRDFSEDHLFLVTSELSHQKEIPVVLGTYFIESLSRYLHGIDKNEFDSLDYTVKQAYLSWVEATRIREKYGCEPPLGFVKTTKPVLIQAGTSREIHGLTKIKHGGYAVNCISEPAIDFDMWERQVMSAATTHSGAAIKQAMMQSLKGQALMVTSALPPDASWEKLLQALKIKYQDKAPYDVLMAQFYGTKMDIDEKCASFGTRLEQKLNQVSLQYPDKISKTMYWNCVRERFFHGLPKDLRTNLRTQFDSGTTYYQMLELARIVESENFHENSGTETKTASNKGKGKINVASVDNPTQQIQQMQQLQGAVKGLTKLLQNNQQQTQLPQIPQFVFQKGTQENVNTLPQATNGQGSTAPQRGRGGRGGYRGRGGIILCYWCRDFLPKEQANHKVAQCPYQKQAKNDWWKNQLSTVQGNAQVAQPNTEEN